MHRQERSVGWPCCVGLASGAMTAISSLARSARRKRQRAKRRVDQGATSVDVSEHATASATDTLAAGEAAQQPEARRQRVLSGVQPTGDLHLGNYFGAINNWVSMQQDYESFFCIVDLHAITVPHEPKMLRQSVLSTAAAYLACGIDAEKSCVFVQSSVPEHAQLNWLLTTQTQMAWLNQMTQYKEKARKQVAGVGAGLFTYPVLMAADILLYQADKVPVGEDQFEHLCLARDIANKMNRIYKKTAYKKRRLFRIPEALIGGAGARVMALSDGNSKMSKSDPDENSRICITDDPTVIKRKVKKCKTDTQEGLELDNPERPEATNLLKLYSLVRRITPQEALAECCDDRWGDFKPKLTEALIAYLEPIQSEYHRLLDDQAFLQGTLEKGKVRAQEVAAQTLQSVEYAMGFGF